MKVSALAFLLIADIDNPRRSLNAVSRPVEPG
jgi:hypothetical protein